MSSSLKNIHPGEILLEEFLMPLGISQNKLAKAIHVSPSRISRIVLGKISITADTDLRLSRALGTHEGYWLGLQGAYDLWKARKKSLAESFASKEEVIKATDKTLNKYADAIKNLTNR